jgi:hypothetical protein
MPFRAILVRPAAILSEGTSEPVELCNDDSEIWFSISFVKGKSSGCVMCFHFLFEGKWYKDPSYLSLDTSQIFLWKKFLLSATAIKVSWKPLGNNLDTSLSVLARIERSK